MTVSTRAARLSIAAAALSALAACAGGPTIGVGVGVGGARGGASVGVSGTVGGAGASGTGGASGTPFSQAGLPAAVQVPPGHTVALETVGVGTVVYECRERAGMPGALAWTFVGPEATLMDRRGRSVGRYFGPPATWVARDGSAITGTQVAEAPAAAGSLPLQLVKASPAASGSGTMTGVAYVQRVATQGGVAPERRCDAASRGQRETLRYRADYIFWKPG